VALEMSSKLEYSRADMVLARIHAADEYRDPDAANKYFEESLKAFARSTPSSKSASST
jgi:hypothetical protein